MKDFDLKLYFQTLKELYEAKAVHEKVIAELHQQHKMLIEHTTIKIPEREEYVSIGYFLCYLLFGYVFGSVIVFLVVGGINVFCHDVLNMNEVAFGLNLPGLVSGILIVLLILYIVFNNTIIAPYRRYRFDYKEAVQKRQKQYEVEKHNKDVLLPEVVKKKTYYTTKLAAIEKRIGELYDLGVIPPKYQTANAAIMMYEYLENGLCISLRDCMLKFEEDASIMELNERIDLLNSDLQSFKRITDSRIGALQRSLERHKHSVQSLIAKTEQSAANTLSSIENNRVYNALIMKNIVDQIDGG